MFQFSEGRFARSMTMTSTGTFLDSSLSPSFSCNAVKMLGPGVASTGGAGAGSPDFNVRESPAGSDVHWKETSYCP
jgi:hypothetical protein